MVAQPLLDSSLSATAGGLLASSDLVAVTGGAANVLGAWVEIVPSLAFTATESYVIGNGVAASGATSQAILDIGVGAAGAETVIVSYLIGGLPNAGRALITLPLRIAAGSRVAARLQCNVASKVLRMAMAFSGGGTLPSDVSEVATVYGLNRATSEGIFLPGAAAANTKTGYVELTAATTRPMRRLLLCAGIPTGAVVVSAPSLLDIAIGAAGAEIVIMADIPLRTTTSEEIAWPFLALPVNLPAGVRIASRFQSAATGATNPNVSVVGFE